MYKLVASSIILLMLSLSGTGHASMSYECWAYVNGSPSKMIHVSADKVSNAKKLAKKRMDKSKIKYDYIECK
ncbi:hypothetical protein C7H09_10830 [Marinobacter fuscus]|uniref:Uncharacterized protein n=1 Tax=Marinobacter fuscus TaxID=2109942 RepID=A0A2T1K7U0_9GAMM|nr:hypothetical protein C7H09_10830 [Marinobacter fuscus]